MNPKHLVIRYFTPIAWSLFPARQIKTLHRFSSIEKDSAEQILKCLKNIKSNHLKAHLFQHVLEELYHGDLFLNVAKQDSQNHFYEEPTSINPLLPNEINHQSLRDAFAYIHIGEKIVNRDFIIYGNSSKSNLLRKVFRRAAADEELHEFSTKDILIKFCDSKWTYRFAIIKAHFKRLWTNYLNLLNIIGKMQLTIILSLIYFIVAPVCLLSLKRRLNMCNREQLIIFQDQVNSFEKSLR